MKPLVLKTILVTTDLSGDTLPALTTARNLAQLWDATLHVVYSVEGITRDTDARIAEWVDQAGGGLDVRVLSGPAGASIIQEAARTRADVIVLGRHRNRAGQPGSTADRVVRAAPVPCLILPNELRLPLSSVLAPLDVTEAARGEMHVALTWASALRGRARPDGETATRIGALYVRSEASDEQNDVLRGRLHTEVTAIRDRLAGIAGVAIEEIVEQGDIARTIVEQADLRDADLIVIGTRGKRLAGDSLGGVSSAVVKAATRPVLLVPPEVWQAAKRDG